MSLRYINEAMSPIEDAMWFAVKNFFYIIEDKIS